MPTVARHCEQCESTALDEFGMCLECGAENPYDQFQIASDAGDDALEDDEPGVSESSEQFGLGDDQNDME